MKKGFTLLEMIVVIGIFSVLSGAIFGIFISGIHSQRKVLTQDQLLEQANYILEYISRALRMARKDDLEGKSCLIGQKVNYEITHNGQGIKFQNYNKQCQEFYLENGQIKEEREGVGVLPLTSSSVQVNFLKFNISGETQTDNLQPKVTIFLEISDKEQNSPKIRLQTTISQRNLDVNY